jgi:hypothetical protein
MTKTRTPTKARPTRPTSRTINDVRAAQDLPPLPEGRGEATMFVPGTDTQPEETRESARRRTLFEAIAFLNSIGEDVHDGDALFEHDPESDAGRFSFAGEEIDVTEERAFADEQRLVHFITGLVIAGKVLCARRMKEDQWLDGDFAGLAAAVGIRPGHDVTWEPDQVSKVTDADPRIARQVGAHAVSSVPRPRR